MENAKKHLEADTLSIQTKVEQGCGCRYSVLLELPYFHPILMCIIDPMHNLLLGTAKPAYTFSLEEKGNH